MIPIKDILTIHKELIDNFGGSHGVRDLISLESALARPFQTYDNTELYKTSLDKASALIESLLINHPFVDGNKRIGYTVLRLFLLQHGLDFTASQASKYDFVIAIATGNLKFEGILSWLTTNTGKRSGT
jgi:death-on-curing protein